jgi:predicted nuclease of predicted toxin-antitoxin system
MHDTEVLAIGVREGRIVVTNDEDFWKLVFNRGYSHSGVILFRPGHMSVESKIRSLELILDDFSDHYHTFFTVTPQGIVARKSMPH